MFPVDIIVMNVFEPSDVSFWAIVRWGSIFMHAHVLLLEEGKHLLFKHMELHSADDRVDEGQTRIAVRNGFEERSDGERLVEGGFISWIVVGCDVFFTILRSKVG